MKTRCEANLWESPSSQVESARGAVACGNSGSCVKKRSSEIEAAAQGCETEGSVAGVYRR